MTRPGSAAYYDPYDFDIDSDPYPVWKRLRDEQPLYYNDRYDFYAVSRFADVEHGLGRLANVQLGQRHAPRAHPQRYGDADRIDDLRGPTGAHRLPRTALARLHTAQDGGHRTAGAPVLRARARPPRGLRRVRLHPRSRRRDADAHDRHARSASPRRTRSRCATTSTTTLRIKDGTMPEDVDGGHARATSRQAPSPTTSTGERIIPPTTS